jgi:hypothetical protein
MLSNQNQVPNEHIVDYQSPYEKYCQDYSS